MARSSTPNLSGSTDDSDARGGFYGLTLDHSRAELLRAVYEGVAVAQCTGLADLSPGVTDLRLTGGGAKSRVGSEMFADVHSDPVAVPDGDELGALGVALCAGVAADVYDDYRAAADAAVGVERLYDPGRRRHLPPPRSRVRVGQRGRAPHMERTE